MRRWLLATLLLAPVSAAGQPPAPPAPLPAGGEPAAQASGSRDPRAQETVEVVAVTPLHGSGVPRLHLPANVQVLGADRLWPGSTDLATLLAVGSGSLHLSETQGGTFQPDVVFRGFSGSPLLGASEGLAVYQDGVRVNEPFGDVLNWDALAPGAIASVNVMAGSNPLFGLNTLGGAISLRTRDGFETRGARLSATAGSFGRYRAEGDVGVQRGAFAGYLAGGWLDEDGWRDFSPSALRRLFAKGSWRGAAARVDVSGTGASNDLIGNGAAPAGLLAWDRAAVFTHPDRTDHDLGALTVRGDRLFSAVARLEAMTYYRRTSIGTLNGDAADDDDSEGPDADAGDGAAFDGVLNRSRTRSHAAGALVQLVSTRPLASRANHLVVGAAADVATSRFGFDAEYATLTPSRGAIGNGLFDDEAAVGLRTRVATGSVFVGDTLDLTPRLHVTGAVRANWTAVRLRDQLGDDLDGDHAFQRVNPSVGATWDVTPWLNAFGGHAQSSRVPTPVELTCADPEDPCRLPNAFVSDPPLDQPVAGTWEAGLRGALRRGSWNVSLFDTRVTDDLIFVSSGPRRGQGHFENVTRTRRRGVETAADWRLARLWLSGSYTWQRATFGTEFRVPSRFHPAATDEELLVRPGDRLPGVPSHVARVSVRAQVTAGLDVVGSWRAQSGQFLRGDEANLLADLPGLAVVDAQARVQLGRRLRLVAQVQNLFDREYATFGVLGDAELLGDAFDDDPRFLSPGAPRAGWIGLELAF